MTDMTNRSLQQMLKNDSKIFYGIFAVGFVLFLSIAVLAQVGHWQWRSWLPGAEGEKSLIGGVKAAVYTFMSHLT